MEKEIIEPQFTYYNYNRVKPPVFDIDEPYIPYSDVLLGNLHSLVSTKVKNKAEELIQEEKKEPEPIIPFIYKGEKNHIKYEPKRERIQAKKWTMPTIVDEKAKENYQLFSLLLDRALREHPEYNTPEWAEFFTHLAFKESTFDPNNENGDHLGYFLIDKEYRKPKWNDPYELFEDMFKLLKDNQRYWRNKFRNDPELKMIFNEIGLDEFGLQAGTWLGGAPNSATALKEGKDFSDGNDSIYARFKEFTLK